jgi:hypothetical protein
MIALPTRRLESLVAPVIAAAVAVAAVVVGWRGVDLAAQVYRVGLFHRSGFTLWDSQWYGGHWTLSYSVIFPPVAGIVGVHLTEILSAGAAAWAFDRLAVGHFGTSARVGSIMFALGTLVQVAVGQLPFLLGEALALGALWAATRGRWRLAGLLAIAASLASPLAAAFLLLAALAWVLASRPRLRLPYVGLVAGPVLVVVALGVLFPGQGVMPFPAVDLLMLLAGGLVVMVLLPPSERVLRIGVLLYLAAALVSFVLRTPMGGNISRLGQCFAAPLAACLVWPYRSRLLTSRLLAVAVVPLVVWQWSPAIGSFTRDRSDPSIHAAYFSPLLGFLADHAEPPGRVEIVPTRLHWEAAYVAPSVPLARGWERQLDTVDNPLFYTEGSLTPASYQAWLLNNGVRYVAMPDVTLDYAGTEEGQLVNAGVPGLRLAWQDRHWRVFEVLGASGIVEAPGRLVHLDGGQLDLQANTPGTIIVRVRYSPRWTLVQGNGCVHPATNGWTAVDANQSGPLRLELRLLSSTHPLCSTSSS